MARLGADVDSLDALAHVFVSAGGQLGRAAGSLTTMLGGVTWTGPDADQFRTMARTPRAAPRSRRRARRHRRDDPRSGRPQRSRRRRRTRARRRHAPERRRARSFARSKTRSAHRAIVRSLEDSLGSPSQIVRSLEDSLGSHSADPDADNNGWPDWLEDSFLGQFLPIGPKYLHAGPDSPWTQQGQGYDPITDEILTTYYDQDDTVENAPDIPGVLLSIQDRESGSESTYVHLTGADGTGGPLHGGGVSTDGEFVYVVGGGTVWVYDRAAIDAAPTGGTVTPLHEIPDIPATSFSTIHGGRLYVGEYVDGDPGSLFSYALGADGALLGEGRYEGPTPHNSQGVAINGNGFLFTQSHGPDHPSDLLYQPFGSDEASTIGELSALSQGLNVIGNQLYVTSEASAYQFDVPDAPVAIDVFDVSDFGLDP